MNKEIKDILTTYKNNSEAAGKILEFCYSSIREIIKEKLETVYDTSIDENDMMQQSYIYILELIPQLRKYKKINYEKVVCGNIEQRIGDYISVNRYDDEYVSLDDNNEVDTCIKSLLTEDLIPLDVYAYSEFLELQNMIRSVMRDLTNTERAVLIMRFGLNGNEPMSMNEIGKRLNLSGTRISQCVAKGLRKLRNPYRSHKLIDFLDGDGIQIHGFIYGPIDSTYSKKIIEEEKKRINNSKAYQKKLHDEKLRKEKAARKAKITTFLNKYNATLEEVETIVSNLKKLNPQNKRFQNGAEEYIFELICDDKEANSRRNNCCIEKVDISPIFNPYSSVCDIISAIDNESFDMSKYNIMEMLNAYLKDTLDMLDISYKSMRTNNNNEIINVKFPKGWRCSYTGMRTATIYDEYLNERMKIHDVSFLGSTYSVITIIPRYEVIKRTHKGSIGGIVLDVVDYELYDNKEKCCVYRTESLPEKGISESSMRLLELMAHNYATKAYRRYMNPVSYWNCI